MAFTKPMKWGVSRLRECWDCGELKPCCGYICHDCRRTRSVLSYRQKEREARIAEKMEMTQFNKYISL